MRKSTCSFCGKDYEIGTGLQKAKNDGTVLLFCPSKCRKNLAMGRSPIHTNWTQRFRDFKAEAAGGKKKTKQTLVERVAEKVEAKKKAKTKKISARKERKKIARKKK